MIDQLTIGDKASFDDFRASVALRSIGVPAKKTIKEKVPFSNNIYDFSKINGELFWEERKLEYVFELLASTPEELEELKAAFTDWVMNVFEEQLHDPFIPDYHFLATYDSMKIDDEDGMDKTTLTVTFTAYPYKIANLPKVHTAEVPVGNTVTLAVINKSSHRVTPTIETDKGITFVYGATRYAVGAGTYTDAKVQLDPGVIYITLDNTAGESVSVVSVSFTEEVF